MTKSQMFKKAHAIAKKLIGNYCVRLSMALKQIWSEIKNPKKESFMINCKMGGYKLVLDEKTGLITGKGTYECKDILKGKWKCTFDGASKGWVLKNKQDIEMFIDMHQDKNAVEVKVEVKATTNTGFCNKCNSYCYGDCTSH